MQNKNQLLLNEKQYKRSTRRALLIAFVNRIGHPGYITLKQHGLLGKTLQSHLFTEEERSTILDSMAWYTVDEAKANIDWTLIELPIRKEKERQRYAEELYDLATSNYQELGEEMTRIYYDLCNKPGITTERLKKIIDELKTILEKQAA